MKLCVLIMVASLMGLVGCGADKTIKSKDVKSHQMWQQYNLTYDLNSEILESDVRLRVNNDRGNYIQLPSSDHIKFNGVAMTETKFRSFVGRSKSATKYITKQGMGSGLSRYRGAHTWSLYDEQTAKTYTTKVNLPPFTVVSISPSAVTSAGTINVDRSGNIEIRWARPLASGERVSAELEVEGPSSEGDRKFTVAMESVSDVGATKLVFSIDKIKKDAPKGMTRADAVLKIKRTHDSKVNNGHPRGGEINLTSIYKNQKFYMSF